MDLIKYSVGIPFHSQANTTLVFLFKKSTGRYFRLGSPAKGGVTLLPVIRVQTACPILARMG